MDDDVVNGGDCKDCDAGLLAEHGASGESQRSPEENPLDQAFLVAAFSGLQLGLPRRNMASVSEKGEEEEYGGEDVSAADDACYRLRVHRVDGEEKGGGPGTRDAEYSSRAVHEGGGQAVENHVAEVVPPGPEPTDPEVEAVREHA